MSKKEQKSNQNLGGRPSGSKDFTLCPIYRKQPDYKSLSKALLDIAKQHSQVEIVRPEGSTMAEEQV